jgi:hypothetical protein
VIRELRVAGLLTSPIFLATLALFCGALVVLRGRWFPLVDALVPLFVILILQQLSFRVVRVGAADIWRLLPGGFTVFIRALALLVLGLALLVGGMWSWSNGQLAFNSVPYGRMLLCFVFLSTISILLMVTIRQRRGELFLAAGVIGSAILVLTLFQMFPNAVLWWAIALLFAAAWLYASSGKLPSPSMSRRAAKSDEVTIGTSLAAIRGWQVRFNSAARNLLQLEGKGLGRLSVAALVVVICALVQHKLHGAGAFITDNYSIRGTMANWLALIFLFEMAVTMTARARLLWLRIGNGRGGVFLAVERVLLVNVALLSLVAWLATTLLAASRGVSIQATQSGLTLLCVAASALAPIYLALIAGTLQGWLSKTPIAILGVAAMIVSPFLWLYALGIRDVGLDAPDYGALSWLAGSILLLRFLASWRWRHLDWSKIRARSREAWLRSELNG